MTVSEVLEKLWSIFVTQLIIERNSAMLGFWRVP